MSMGVPGQWSHLIHRTAKEQQGFIMSLNHLLETKAFPWWRIPGFLWPSLLLLLSSSLISPRSYPLPPCHHPKQNTIMGPKDQPLLTFFLHPLLNSPLSPPRQINTLSQQTPCNNILCDVMDHSIQCYSAIQVTASKLFPI